MRNTLDKAPVWFFHALNDSYQSPPFLVLRATAGKMPPRERMRIVHPFVLDQNRPQKRPLVSVAPACVATGIATVSITGITEPRKTHISPPFRIRTVALSPSQNLNKSRIADPRTLNG